MTPMAKTDDTAIFFRLVVCRLHMIFCGRIRMARSETTLIAALETNITLLSTHFPGRDLFHIFSWGEHDSADANIDAV